MSNNFKYGFILDSFFKKYFSKINCYDNYQKDLIKHLELKDKYIVFIGKSVDFVEFLYINHTLKELNLRNIDYVNELKTFLWETPWGLLNKTVTNIGKKPKIRLKTTLNNFYPAMIFLKKSNFLNLNISEFKVNPLLELIKFQKSVKKPVILIPEVLVLEKIPESFKGYINQKGQPSFLKVAYKLIRYYKNAYAKLLPSIDLQSFLNQYSKEEEQLQAEILWGKLAFQLDKEEQIIRGPIIRSLKLNIEQILSTNHVQTIIKEKAKEKRISIDEAKVIAKKQLEKISANYKATTVGKFSGILGVIFRKIYDNINLDKKQLEDLKELMKTYTLILVPCHKSHIDYLVLSHLFYSRGLVAPHIAAGENLSFFPLGTLFKRSGAFFLKRSFKTDKFYYTLFREYLIKLLKDRFSIEFFIEGTRSRTGKLMPPKLGMLSMLFDAYLEGINKKIAIVPVSINYEKVIEERSYLKELSGKEKEKEGINTLLNSRKVLKSKFGRIYIRFASPIEMDKYFYDHGIVANLIKDDERKYHINKIAYKILHKINEACIVTASSVLGIALLTSNQNKLEFSEILGRFLSVYKLINMKKNIPISNTLSTPVLALEEALDFFISNKHITLIDPDRELYQFSKSQRGGIEYYKNNIIHHFINDAIIITAATRYNKIDKIRNEAKKLSNIFKDEFVFNSDDRYDSNFIQTLTGLVLNKVVFKDGDLITLNEECKKSVLGPPFYRNILSNFIDSYHFCIKELTSLDVVEKYPYKELLKNIIQNGYKKDGIVFFEEAINKNKFENCFNILIGENILLSEYDGKVKYIAIRSQDKLIELYNFIAEYRKITISDKGERF